MRNKLTFSIFLAFFLVARAIACLTGMKRPQSLFSTPALSCLSAFSLAVLFPWILSPQTPAHPTPHGQPSTQCSPSKGRQWPLYLKLHPALPPPSLATLFPLSSSLLFLFFCIVCLLIIYHIINQWINFLCIDCLPLLGILHESGNLWVFCLLM